MAPLSILRKLVTYSILILPEVLDTAVILTLCRLKKVLNKFKLVDLILVFFSFKSLKMYVVQSFHSVKRAVQRHL